ncbi:hypothetical protein EJ02DRAFT_453966 [Clathrospora elynae]|uniref:Uncharacterized protein n=1 Tax=Clathrospora elynae TaxID=706981 RepID=A0A6A5SSS4_9PLEO|nr:hypothetical protein EJ02DRAFT_453966 [Clathrospora elynae]
MGSIPLHLELLNPARQRQLRKAIESPPRSASMCLAMSDPIQNQSPLFLLVQQLPQELQNQRVEIQSLRSGLDASRVSVHQLELRLSSVTPPSPSRSRLSNPPRFDGKPL